MHPSRPFYIDDCDPQKITRALQGVDTGQLLIVLIAEGCNPDLHRINDVFMDFGFDYAGAMFPKIVYGENSFDQGMILLPVNASASPIVVDGLDKGVFQTDQFPPPDRLRDHTLMIFVDGLSKHIAEFLRTLYGHYGADVVYLGGGAGSLSLQQAPCLFSRSGVSQDQAIIVPFPARLKLGVRHGWTRLMGPLIATDVDMNTIRQINWQPAFEVYREVVEQAAGEKLTHDNFFSIAKGYPFGLEKHDSEDIVRDPIMATENGELVCVGEVPENAIMHILQGNANSLTHSAQTAASDSTGQLSGPPQMALIVDCISRTLFLGQEFNHELQAVNRVFRNQGSRNETVGAMTLGEISSIGDGYLEFLNKTVVIGSID